MSIENKQISEYRQRIITVFSKYQDLSKDEIEKLADRMERANNEMLTRLQSQRNEHREIPYLPKHFQSASLPPINIPYHQPLPTSMYAKENCLVGVGVPKFKNGR